MTYRGPAGCRRRVWPVREVMLGGLAQVLSDGLTGLVEGTAGNAIREGLDGGVGGR